MGLAGLLATFPAGAAEPVPPDPVSVGAPSGADPTGIGNPFRERTGIVTHYVRDPEGYDGFRYPATTWRSITEQIESGWYAERGINHLLLYGAWRSTPEFLGLPALDFFDVQVGTGTMADLDAMVAAAKARDMGLLMYLQLIYLSPQHPAFVKAAQDVVDGVDSFERRLFRWDERPQPQADCPADPGMSWATTWTRDPSIAGGRCYVQAWGELAGTLPFGFPALDFERPEAMEYAKQVMSFWIDKGINGFIYDAMHTYLGMHDPEHDPVHLARQRELHVEHPRDHVRPDGTRAVGWTHDEGTFGDFANATGADLMGLTHVRVQGGDDSDSFATQAMRVPAIDGRTVEQLEDHWATFVDPRRQHGGGGVASLPYGTDDVIPGPIRALDAAIQAGGTGVEYYLSYQHHLPDMSAESQELLWDVLRTIRRSPALAPGASRERVPSASAAGRSHAVVRRSMDGSATALGVFNLADIPQCIAIDLRGTGMRVPQTPTDLATGQPGPRLTSERTAIALPAYGYLFLDVEAGAGFPWRVIDTAADDWRLEGGWARVEDPSAVGESRITGMRAGGSAEVTFEGRSVQGWGRMTMRSATQVEVFVDGVSHGIHSQRRRAPIGDASVSYGQRLFSIGDLAPGPHVLRIVQVTGGGEAGIDMVRVSGEPWVEPVTPDMPDQADCRP